MYIVRIFSPEGFQGTNITLKKYEGLLWFFGAKDYARKNHLQGKPLARVSQAAKSASNLHQVRKYPVRVNPEPVFLYLKGEAKWVGLIR